MSGDARRRLMWCETHCEPAWLYVDGSRSCWYDSIVEATTEHALTELPEVQVSRKLVAAARTLAAASEAEMIRLTDMAYPNGGFQCPADPCPYCTAQDEFAIALMDYEDQ